MAKKNTGKGAAGLAGSSTEGLRSTAAAAPKPAKKPTTGEKIARWSMCFPFALPACHEARLRYKIDRALAAAVKKERVRCMKIAESFHCEVVAEEIRSGQ